MDNLKESTSPLKSNYFDERAGEDLDNLTEPDENIVVPQEL